MKICLLLLLFLILLRPVLSVEVLFLLLVTGFTVHTAVIRGTQVKCPR
jgi:hypothetical protein